MLTLVPSLICATLAFATGIFVVLSLIEKPIWRLMWNRDVTAAPEEKIRAVHAQLKCVIHLLPPTMITVVLGTLGLLIYQLVLFEFSFTSWTVLGLFVSQQFFIVLRLKKDINNVEMVPSDGDIVQVRSGLGALALLHHRGLLSVSSTLFAQIIFIAT